MSFDLSAWDGFSDLPKEGLDYLLDTTAINKRLADKKDSPYRMRVASWSVPITLKGAGLEKACKQAVDKWLAVFAKQGWELASKVQIYPGKRFAHDLDIGVLMLDKREICARAIFKTKPKPVRIELPASSVRWNPEQKSSLTDVMKGEGIAAVPLKERIN